MFFKNMSDRAGKILKDDIEALGPVRLRDVDEAQSGIVAIAKASWRHRARSRSSRARMRNWWWDRHGCIPAKAPQRSHVLGVLAVRQRLRRPKVVPEPEVIEPLFSAAEVAAAREAARRDGHAAGLQEAASSDATAVRQALEAIASQFKDERDAAAMRADQSAEAIAGLLLDSLAATFPVLCARHGEAEVRAIARAVLPALTLEPMIAVRVNPRTAPALAQEIARLDPDIAAHVETIECDAMPPGDVRIAWHNGAAMRDAASLWERVASVLVPAGLLRADAMIKETVDAC